MVTQPKYHDILVSRLIYLKPTTYDTSMAVVLPWTSWGGDCTWESPDKGPSGTDGDLGRVPAVMRGYLWTHPSCRTGEKRQQWRCPHITTPATCTLKYTDYEEKNCMLTVSRNSNGVAVESLNSNFCITISSMRWMSRPLHAHSYWWTRTLKSDSTAYVYAWVYGQQDMNSVKTQNIKYTINSDTKQQLAWLHCCTPPTQDKYTSHVSIHKRNLFRLGNITALLTSLTSDCSSSLAAM